MTHREAIATALAMCEAAYPNIRIKPQTPHVWESLLRDIAPEHIVAGMRDVLREYNRASLPPVSLVRKRALEHKEGLERRIKHIMINIAYLDAIPPSERTEEEERLLAAYRRDLDSLQGASGALMSDR